ncbi:hypothetical protein FQN57_007235 [Myotisia sp. PD_48]|nr:hypothetical protein FQN57_007235 [Myotisia sp. PD_48]
MQSPPIPKPSDFPSSLNLTITPPDSQRSSNILLLLHGLGDSLTPFTSFGAALHLPETTCITLQAPTPLPFELPGYHWGDDLVFEADILDSDPGFTRSTRLIVQDLIRSVLVDKLGYSGRDILIFGFAQGASVALSVALELHRENAESSPTGNNNDTARRELGGVIAVGGVLPLSAIKEQGSRANKSKTPVLVLGGSSQGSAVSEGGVRRTKGEFEYVEVVRWKGKREDTMPRNREEMLPIMQFFGRRLRSYSGVPEGSIEIG